MAAVSPADYHDGARAIIRIRKSRPQDLSRLFDVWRSAVEATHDFVSAEDKAEIARLVRDEYLPNADLDVAIDANDVPQAFMGMTGNEIDALFVHADARGTGIGRSMVELAVERCGDLTTEVNEQNTRGVLFWKHMGFTMTGRTPTDGQGRPYPILRMERPAGAAWGDRNDA